MNVLVGITGSVAAYKAVYLIRALQKKGYTVRAVLTPSARAFVGPTGLEALTGFPAYDQLFGEGLPQSPPLHIALARWILERIAEVHHEGPDLARPDTGA